MSMREAMVNAVRSTAGFVGRATMQAAERIIPHGANELAAAINTGNAYAPPGVTEGLTSKAPPIAPPTAPTQAASGPAIGPPRPAQAATQSAPSISPPATPRPAYTPPQVQSTVHGNTQTRGRSM